MRTNADTLRSPVTLPQRILIADDHPVVLFGLRFLFEQEEGFEICGEARDAAETLMQTAELQPDFVILDLVMGGADGIPLVRNLAELHGNTRILVYSSHDERIFAHRVLRAGGHGFVSKSEGLQVVGATIRAMANGRGRPYRDLLDGSAAASVRQHASAAPLVESLSDRELQILGMIGRAKTSGAIAAELNLSIKTIGTYRERIKIKLGLSRSRDLEKAAEDYAQGCWT